MNYLRSFHIASLVKNVLNYIFDPEARHFLKRKKSLLNHVDKVRNKSCCCQVGSFLPGQVLVISQVLKSTWVVSPFTSQSEQ